MGAPGYDQRKAAFGMLKKRPKKSEANMQKNICQYISYQYGNICRFSSDMGGIYLTKAQGAALKPIRSHRGHPDLTIYSKRGVLMLELKAEGADPYTKKDRLKAGGHVAEQAAYIDFLNDVPGITAAFAVGFAQAKLIIDNFFK